MGRIEGAVHDYEKILELEPNNKPAKLELEKILDKLEQKEESKDEKEKEEKAQVEKLNLKNNMKGMFASVKATERLEPENDFTPSLLLGSGDGERMKPVGELKPIPAPWKEPDPDLLVQPIKKPPHLRYSDKDKRTSLFVFNLNVQMYILGPLDCVVYSLLARCRWQSGDSISGALSDFYSYSDLMFRFQMVF